jgi:homoserine kinase
MKKISVSAPATIANIVCGFDILGLALEHPGDIMHLELLDTPGITITQQGGYDLPLKPEDNVAGAALLALMEAYDKPVGFHVHIDKHIKPGSGLGSSAASSAGAVVAANHLLGNVFSNADLVRFAMNGEKVASGVKHADNITPCIYGGITLIRSIFPLDIVQLHTPALHVTVVHPQIEVKTSDARQILRKEVQLKDAIKQWGNIAGLVAGFMQSDYGLISRSLQDVIIEPVRSILIPGFDEVKQRCKSVGALGGGISGSGPSIFMLSQHEQTAKAVEHEMQTVYNAIGIEYKTYVTKVNHGGVQVLQTS